MGLSLEFLGGCVHELLPGVEHLVIQAGRYRGGECYPTESGLPELCFVLEWFCAGPLWPGVWAVQKEERCL